MSIQHTSTSNTTLTQSVVPINDMKQFEQSLCAWVQADTVCKHYTKKAEEHRKTRTELQPSICEYMERTRRQKQPIQISDGTLTYATEKVKPALSQKLLAATIPAFFEEEALHGTSTNDPKVRTEALLQFVNKHRAPEVRATIRRKYTNTSETNGS